ncbi:hypothetical protein GCM10010406_39710 [Streptomyces thermolineatus]|uniref:Uncharacterized protein n=1 Tax=Streptomyces thermolineatus TaxID=44033 RepID=A0ABN3MC92_9ACTN
MLTHLRGDHARFARSVDSATSKVRAPPADSLYPAWAVQSSDEGIRLPLLPARDAALYSGGGAPQPAAPSEACGVACRQRSATAAPSLPS